MAISVDFEQQLRGPWDTASGFLIEQLELMQAQLAPLFASAASTSTPVTPSPTYNAGTWIPTITGDGGGSGQVYASQQGNYIKIGKSVTVTFFVQLSVKGTMAGNCVLGGLPFSTSGLSSSAVTWLATTTTWVSMMAVTIGGNNFLYLQGAGAASTQNNLNVKPADITNNTMFMGTATYFTL